VQKIGFGGGCHWCTEAIFDALKGVQKVEQGWIRSSLPETSSASEAVIVYFDSRTISLEILIEVHLLTHNATSAHSMREKYRSAVYTFSPSQQKVVQQILKQKQSLFDEPLVTKSYPFESFKVNMEKYLHYYKQNPAKPFCQTYIKPKLKMLLKRYSSYTKDSL
jgi:peptide-methionine (S)-S-oxide reductase